MSEAEAIFLEGFKALGHPLRYQILRTISGTERNVGEIEQASGISQPALSQQLAILRKAGLVTTRRDAKQIYYSLAADRLKDVTKAIDGLMPQGETAKAASSHTKRTGAAVFARMNI